MAQHPPARFVLMGLSEIDLRAPKDWLLAHQPQNDYPILSITHIVFKL